MRSHVTVEVCQEIGRPLEIVRSQFLDIEHHATQNVHPWLQLAEIKSSPEGCSFVQTIKTFGRDRTNRVWHFRKGQEVISEYVEGPDKGVRSMVCFEALSPEVTRVTNRTTIPLSGLAVLMKPLAARAVRDTAIRALEEDRRDLEEGGFEPGHVSAPGSWIAA